MKKIFLTLALAITTLSASAHNVFNQHCIYSPSFGEGQGERAIDTLIVTTTPQMHCSNCENKIKSNIRFVKGIKKIETSVPEQKVTIIYDNQKFDFNKLEAAFRKIGYTIKEVKDNK